jgi:predicted RNase H-like nuclease (RuvC/YqgF family)
VEVLSEKMTVLNIRMSTDEKEDLKARAEENGDSISSYARKILFQEDSTSDYVDNTNVIQEKDERISDLKSQIDDYKKQIDQLHTIILATQKDNQLLIEQKTKRWWKFWK